MKKIVFIAGLVATGLLAGMVQAEAEPQAEPWRVERGPDGRAVAVPPGGTAVSGDDARIVAVPPGWRVERGPDARAVAVPPEGTVRQGPDARRIALPEGWTFEIGLDGRGVAVPPGGRTASGSDARRIAVPEGWTVETGLDGRAVAVPPGGTTVQGRDERLVAIPEGWSTGVGANERVVAVPPGGEVVQGADGLAVAVPPDDFDAGDLLLRMLIFDMQSQIRRWQVSITVRDASVFSGSTVDVSETIYLSGLGSELARGQEYMMPLLTEMDLEGLQWEVSQYDPLFQAPLIAISGMVETD